MPELTSQKPTILLVDDEQGMRETLSDILIEEGYHVIPFATGQEAIKEIRKGLFDVIVADLRLPDSGGMQVLEEAKEVNPESAVIVMTGYASLESAVEALNRGAFSYIIKPFNVDEVKAVIKKAMHQQRLFKENQRLIDELQLFGRQLERANSELKKASQLKSQFLANMSHELRTPLSAIIGFTDLLLEDKELGEPYRRDMLRIQINSQNLLALINDILDLSKIEAGKISLSPSEFHPESLLKECVLSLSLILKDKPIKLEIEMSPDIPKLYTDGDRLRQIMINLLSNASKFTDEGEIRVTGRVDDNGMVNLSVSDTGIGIREEDLSYIFDEFRQVGRRKKQGGTGLGLSIAKRLAHLLGGNILVQSIFGKGSTFTLVIPPKLNKQEMI